MAIASFAAFLISDRHEKKPSVDRSNAAIRTVSVRGTLEVNVFPRKAAGAIMRWPIMGYSHRL